MPNIWRTRAPNKADRLRIARMATEARVASASLWVFERPA
jgi:hypothetical protein